MCAFLELTKLLQTLGFMLNEKKVVHPTTKLVFLGIQIDTIKVELSSPNEKLYAIKNFVSDFLQQKRVTKRQLQSIVGKRSHAAKMVCAARLFLRRLFNVIGKLQRQHHRGQSRQISRGGTPSWCSLIG